MIWVILTVLAVSIAIAIIIHPLWVACLVAPVAGFALAIVMFHVQRWRRLRRWDNVTTISFEDGQYSRDTYPRKRQDWRGMGGGKSA